MFEEEVMGHRKKGHKATQYLFPQRFNRGIRNWKLPDVIEFNPINENKPSLKHVINL